MRGLTFHEVMTGQLSLRAPDPRKGYRQPGSVGIAFRAKIEIANIETFLTDPQHRGALTSNVEVPRWGAQSTDSEGLFGLFVPAEPSMTHMIYQSPIMINGLPHRLCGVKELRVAGPWRLWPATTTLLVEVRQGADGAGAPVGSGILRLSLTGFVSMIATMRGTGGRWPLRHMAVVQFMIFFVRGLVATYLLGRRP